jgi:hypothetical protein
MLSLVVRILPQRIVALLHVQFAQASKFDVCINLPGFCRFEFVTFLILLDSHFRAVYLLNQLMIVRHSPSVKRTSRETLLPLVEDEFCGLRCVPSLVPIPREVFNLGKCALSQHHENSSREQLATPLAAMDVFPPVQEASSAQTHKVLCIACLYDFQDYVDCLLFRNFCCRFLERNSLILLSF